MKNDAEEKVSRFYNEQGWRTDGEVTEDAKRWEDLREHAKDYVSRCRRRILRHIPEQGENMLDMASGPIQYKEYLEYSKGFKKRYCVDLSSPALENAKTKIGSHGVFICGSFFDIEFEKDFFDCVISLHTLYHIDRERQEQAVRKLISVTKPGRPIIIVYSNPKALVRYLTFPIRLIISAIRRISRFLQSNRTTRRKPDLYFFAYPIRWWDRFGDSADIEILPWRSFSSDYQKLLVPDNKFGKKMLDVLFTLEDRYPRIFVKHFQYPMIILTKIEQPPRG